MSCLCFFALGIDFGISSQVKDVIGYAPLPGALTIEMRKSVFGGSFAAIPAAAAVADSIEGSTYSPA